MGGTASTLDKHYNRDASMSTDDSESNSGSRRNSRSNSILSNAAILNFISPVKASFLSVPNIEGHPFGEYRYIKQIGKGAFSKVFKCIGTTSSNENKRFAIKEVDTCKFNKQQQADLQLEMNILSQLKHASIVRLNSVYTIKNKLFLVMEYLRGGELLDAICKRERYTEGDARRILIEITSALQYMHARKVIHRDIKPENLILETISAKSKIKIVDFGFATVVNESSGKPTKYLCGTPGYMPPEVIRDMSYTTAVDCWSLGVITYILLSGTMPFDSRNEQKVLNGSYAFPACRWKEISESAKDLVSKLLVVDTKDRFTTTDVLNHPWMQIPCDLDGDDHEPSVISSHNDDVDITDTLEELRKFNAVRKLRKSIIVVTSAIKFMKAGFVQRIRKDSEGCLDSQSIIALQNPINNNGSPLISNVNKTLDPANAMVEGSDNENGEERARSRTFTDDSEENLNDSNARLEEEMLDKVRVRYFEDSEDEAG